MTSRKSLLAPIAFAVVAAVTIAPVASGQQRERDAREIRELSEKWQRDIAAQNIHDIVDLHAPDAVIMMSHAPLIKGTAGVQNAWTEMVKTPGLKVQWTPTRIDVVSPTVANEYGTYTESYDTPQGRGTDAGNYITIWHKINGKWRVALDAANTTSPLPAAPMESSEMLMRSASALAWSDLSVPGVPPGIKLAVLSGDPGKTGPFVARLQFPDGYQIPLHWHPTAENVTLLSGQIDLGMGNSVDMSKLHSYVAGDYAAIPARQPHFGVVHGLTTVQVHGQGPFVINLGVPK
jgi:uncharacterized protein (TIGR02246 family)